MAQISSQHVREEDITIMTMYKSEIPKIRELLGNKAIAVCSLDSFQGKENEVLILHVSAAKRGNANPVGFTGEVIRLNVALSRAKEAMFVVGNGTFWQHRWTRSLSMVGTSKGHRIRLQMTRCLRRCAGSIIKMSQDR
jgi:superfamily I DNA and/or RNA helicase